MQEHERVLWRCAQAVSAAVEDQPWLALIGGTALRHLTWLQRASIDLDFVVAGPGYQVGDWVRRVLERTAGVTPGTVVVRGEDRRQTELAYVSSATQTTQVLKVDKLDAALRNVDLRRDAITYEAVRTLHHEKVAELKLETLVGDQPRLKARDIYDSTHLMRRYSCALTMEQLTTLGRIADGLFEREEEWLQRFRRDEVLSEKEFPIVREAFTKTASWRKRLAEHGEEFQPVEEKGPQSTVVIEAAQVRLVDNRPTHEGETIGVAHEPAEAAAMLVEAGIGEPQQQDALIATLKQRMREERINDETSPAGQARRVHEGRTRHLNPEVRADAHVALAALSGSADAAAQLAAVLDADPEIASNPVAALALRNGAAALKAPEEGEKLRQGAIAAAKTATARTELRQAIKVEDSQTDTDGENQEKSRDGKTRPAKSRLD